MKNLRMITFDKDGKIINIYEYGHINSISDMYTKRGNLIKQLTTHILEEQTIGCKIRFEWSDMTPFIWRN